jgi:GNAT superfamily N-acetyltransferase
MKVEIRREDYRSLGAYSSVPISFDVREVVDVADLRVGDTTFSTQPVVAPYRKNYDALSQNDPSSWPRRFDVSGWVVLAAYAGSDRVGGAIVVADAALATRLSDRATLAAFAVLWDLRVGPAWRGRGAGKALIAAAEEAARRTGVRWIEVETQDVNVPACRLYATCGYAVSALMPGAYREVPRETKLVWAKSLV